MDAKRDTPQARPQSDTRAESHSGSRGGLATRTSAALRTDGPAAARLGWIGLALVGLFYFYNLDGYLINDDEGSYLYAAWRISLGELPYHDFLTPQLPAFLLPGGMLMKLVGPVTWPLRAMSVVLTLASGLLVWKTARLLFGATVAAGAALGFLLHPLVFHFGRLYRSEAFMLFFALLGVYAFARAYFGAETGPDGAPGDAEPETLPGLRPARAPQRAHRPWLVLSGAAFGLAMLSKLFGILPMAGCGLWLLVDGRRRRRPMARILVDGLLFTASTALVAGGGFGYYLSTSPAFYEATFGHHVMQGKEVTRLQEVLNTLEFYLEFVDTDQGGLLLFGALAAAATAWRLRDRRVLLLGCQIVSMLGFFLLTRELFLRHLMYLLPALITLCFVALVPVLARPEAHDDRTAGMALGQRMLAMALVLSLIVPWLADDLFFAVETETGTPAIRDFIQLVTEPNEIVFGDFSELNFYALRPSTYEGASLSAGAAGSGQLAWSVMRPRFDDQLPALLVNLDTGVDSGHLSHMPDHDVFLAWVEEHFTKLGVFERDWQVYHLYAPKEGRPAPLARHTDGPTLLNARPSTSNIPAGEPIQAITAWRNAPPEEPGTEYVATLRLVDLAGQQWAQWDTSLFAAGERKTPRWAPDELTSQRFDLDVPPDAPPGRYRLEIGMYRRNGDAVPRLSEAGDRIYERALVGEVEVTPGSLRDVPESAGDVVRVDAKSSGGYTLLAHSVLPEEAMSGDTLALDTWWRVEPDSEPRSLGIFACRAGGCIPFPVSGLRALGAPGNPIPSEASESSIPTGSILRQRFQVPVLTAEGERTFAIGVVDDARWSSSQHASSPDVDLATVPWLERWTPTQDPSSAASGAPDLPATLLPLARLDVRPGSAVESEEGCLPPARYDSAVAPELHAAFGDLARLQDVWTDQAGVPLRVIADRTALEPGSPLPIQLDWYALRSDPERWRVSVQMLDADDQPVAQSDAEPGNWEHPTTEWRAGAHYCDPHTLQIPADLAPGDYRLVAALYHPRTGWRLPVYGEDALGDMALLGTVTVGEAARE